MKRTVWGWAPRQLTSNGVRAAARHRFQRSWVWRGVSRDVQQPVAFRSTGWPRWLTPAGLLTLGLAFGMALARLRARVRARRSTGSPLGAASGRRRTTKMDTSNLTNVIAARALSLEAVTQRRMFGGDAWLVHGKMFGFMGDMGLVVKPPPEEREALLTLPGASVFEARPGVPFGGWIALSLAAAQQEDATLAALERSYHHVRNASQEAQPRRRRTRRQTVTG